MFLACAEEKEASDTSPSVTAKVAGASATPTQITDTPAPVPTPGPAPVTPSPTEAPTPVVTAPPPTRAPTEPPQPACHPSYEGACLNPNASDYDCAGGSGNGPYYTGPVRGVGPDVFDLDRDGDGYGCE